MVTKHAELDAATELYKEYVEIVSMLVAMIRDSSKWILK